jgi:hypothetical protein
MLLLLLLLHVQVNLHAAVDHMHGVACAVQQVQEVATADAPLPQVQRGMTTKLTKDRMVSTVLAVLSAFTATGLAALAVL